MRRAPHRVRGSVNLVTNLQSVLFGGLIVFFLTVEPKGRARLWERQ